jgi:hypothetical protein
MVIGSFLFLAALWFDRLLQRDWRCLASVALGYSAAGLPLLHNLVFDGSTVPFVSSAGQSYLNPPRNFLLALSELVRGETSGPAVSAISIQFTRWSEPNGVMGIFFVVTLIWFFKTVLKTGVDAIGRAVAFGVLGLHGVLWIYQPTGRYGHMAWILTGFLALWCYARNKAYERAQALSS